MHRLLKDCVSDVSADPKICHMRISIFQLALFVSVGLLLSPPALAQASSPPADSVHFCAFDEHQQWRRDHPRPAAKPLANLNVGEPRTVRMIYFLPNDWPYRAEVVDSMKTAIKQSQTFYLEQMQAHGYGDWTFRIETDAQGEPLVHRVDSQHPYSHYENSFALEATIIEEIEQSFDLDANIYVIVLGTDLLRWRGGTWAGGVGSRETKNGGYVLVASEFSWDLVAHELGHAFGLPHYYSDGAYIMSYGGPSQFPGASTWDRISACSAEFLAVHTYFNPASRLKRDSRPSSNSFRPLDILRARQACRCGFRSAIPRGFTSWPYRRHGSFVMAWRARPVPSLKSTMMASIFGVLSS